MCALEEPGDDAGLLPTEDDEWSDEFRKSNGGELNFGETGRWNFPSGEIRFNELVLRKLDAWGRVTLSFLAKRFQNGLFLGLSPCSIGGEGRVGEDAALRPRLIEGFFLTRLLLESCRLRPPVLMDVFESSVAVSVTLFPPARISSTTWR